MALYRHEQISFCLYALEKRAKNIRRTGKQSKAIKELSMLDRCFTRTLRIIQWIERGYFSNNICISNGSFISVHHEGKKWTRDCIKSTNEDQESSEFEEIKFLAGSLDRERLSLLKMCLFMCMISPEFTAKFPKYCWCHVLKEKKSHHLSIAWANQSTTSDGNHDRLVSRELSIVLASLHEERGRASLRHWGTVSGCPVYYWLNS